MRYVGYLRWSSDKQGKGSSDDRQRETIEEYCDQEGWSIDQWLTDDGVSASTGANVKTGDLSDFINHIEIAGGQDYTLLVECQDRLSRLHEWDFFEWFIGVLKTGLTVVFCDNEMVVDRSSIRNQKRQMRRIMDDQEEAHRYTAKLSRRVRKAYDEMRETGIKVHNSATCPAWLELIDKKRSGFLRRPDKVKVLNDIFEWYVDGQPIRAIAKRLNRDGVPTFRGGKGWAASAVKALLVNRAVIGEYQHKSRARGGALIGDPIPDYFPVAITNELFQAAQDPRLRRIQTKRTQGDGFRNLFSDIARCHRCGARMIYHGKSSRNGGQRLYLQCDNYMRDRGCDQCRMVNYDTVEKMIVDLLLVSALDDQHFQKGDDVRRLSALLADQRRAFEDATKLRENRGIAHADKPSDDFLRGLYERSVEEFEHTKEAMDKTEAELVLAKGAVSPSEHVKRVAEIAADLNSDDEKARHHARRVTKLAFNDLIELFEIEAGSERKRAGRTERQIGVIVLKGSMRFIHMCPPSAPMAQI